MDKAKKPVSPTWMDKVRISAPDRNEKQLFFYQITLLHARVKIDLNQGTMSPEAS